MSGPTSAWVHMTHMGGHSPHVGLRCGPPVASEPSSAAQTRTQPMRTWCRRPAASRSLMSPGACIVGLIVSGQDSGQRASGVATGNPQPLLSARVPTLVTSHGCNAPSVTSTTPEPQLELLSGGVHRVGAAGRAGGPRHRRVHTFTVEKHARQAPGADSAQRNSVRPRCPWLATAGWRRLTEACLIDAPAPDQPRSPPSTAVVVPFMGL